MQTNEDILRKIRDDVQKYCESHEFRFGNDSVGLERLYGETSLWQNDETGETSWLLDRVTTQDGVVIDTFEHPGWTKVKVECISIEINTTGVTDSTMTMGDLNWRSFYQRTKDGYGDAKCAIVGARYDDTTDITQNIEWIECHAGHITANEYLLKCRGLGKLVDLSKDDESTGKRICVTFFIIDQQEKTAYCSMLRLEPHSYDITSDGIYMIGIGSITSLPMNYDLMLSIYNTGKQEEENHAE